MDLITTKPTAQWTAPLGWPSRDLLPHRRQRLPMRSVLQYDPAHEGTKRNIEQVERMLKGLQVRQQKQGR